MVYFLDRSAGFYEEEIVSNKNTGETLSICKQKSFMTRDDSSIGIRRGVEKTTKTGTSTDRNVSGSVRFVSSRPAIFSLHPAWPRPRPGLAPRPRPDLAPRPRPGLAPRPRHGLAPRPRPGLVPRPRPGLAPPVRFLARPTVFRQFGPFWEKALTIVSFGLIIFRPKFFSTHFLRDPDLNIKIERHKQIRIYKRPPYINILPPHPRCSSEHPKGGSSRRKKLWS